MVLTWRRSTQSLDLAAIIINIIVVFYHDHLPDRGYAHCLNHVFSAQCLLSITYMLNSLQAAEAVKFNKACCVLHELAVSLSKEIYEQTPGVQRCCVGSEKYPGQTGDL